MWHRHRWQVVHEEFQYEYVHTFSMNVSAFWEQWCVCSTCGKRQYDRVSRPVADPWIDEGKLPE